VRTLECYGGNKLDTKATAERIRKDFYESYDVEYWITRGRMLHLLIVRNDIRRAVIDALDHFDKEETIVNRFKTDLHFLTFHSVESLFALIFATVKFWDCPWIWLTSYTTSEFNDLLHKVAEDGLNSLGVDAKILFYNPPPTETDDRIQRSSSLIEKYLKAIAREFTERGEYNSFKHGLRTMRTHASEITLSTEPGGKPLWSAEALVTTYLELQALKGKSNQRKVSSVTKAIDFERSFRILEFNTHLMTNLIRIGRAIARHETTANLFTVDNDTDLSELLRPTVLAGQKPGFTNFRFDFPLIISLRDGK
jgi:hypothetical protein